MSLEEFFVDDQVRTPPKWGSVIERQIKLRIKLSLAAYTYELLDTSIISDTEFDALCKQVDLKINTGNQKLDRFFKNHFDPSTGQWIHKHPELDKLAVLYNKYYYKGIKHVNCI